MPTDSDPKLQPVSSPQTRQTKTVRHRFPRKKVEEVWRPLSESSCKIVEETLQQAIRSHAKHNSLELHRLQQRAQTLTSKMRVPVGVYSGIKLNAEGQVEVICLEDLMRKNRELEAIIVRKEGGQQAKFAT